MEKTLHEQLVDIQQRLEAPKSHYSDFGGYYYRSSEDILNSLKPLLKEYGLAIYLYDEMVNLGERYYVKATATISNGKATITTTAYGREALSKTKMDEAQITGSASSYARKYALNGLLAIDDAKDIDSMDNTLKAPKIAPQSQEKPSEEAPWMDKKMSNETPVMFATDKQVKFIHTLLDQKGQKKEDLYKKYNVESISQLPIMDAKQIIENLLKLPDELPERDIHDEV